MQNLTITVNGTKYPVTTAYSLREVSINNKIFAVDVTNDATADLYQLARDIKDYYKATVKTFTKFGKEFTLVTKAGNHIILSGNIELVRLSVNQADSVKQAIVTQAIKASLATTEPVVTEPVAEPVGAKPVVTEPVGAKPVVAEPVAVTEPKDIEACLKELKPAKEYSSRAYGYDWIYRYLHWWNNNWGQTNKSSQVWLNINLH